MPLAPKNIVLRGKILAGIEKAHAKLLESRARNNDTVVVSVNGVAQHVPAKEILARQGRKKG